MALEQFNGKTALVTGTTGIGRAIALRFAKGGANVVAYGADEAANKELMSVASEKGLPLAVETGSVIDPAMVQSLVTGAAKRFGGISILVNAAAIHPFGNVVELDFETWNRCMAVNVGGIYLLAHYVIPEMKRSGGGCIINLSSVQGYACQPRVAAYVASKGAVHSLTRALALDHAVDGIRVNSISPGSVRTPMLSYAASYLYPDLPEDEVIGRFGAAHPLGRVAEAEEIAEMAAFLASERAAFCTGSDFVVDGGLLAALGAR
jgi:NAD(P)-dependent dehydrogenase (short-subunit alcohol dehydrogenase family)